MYDHHHHNDHNHLRTIVHFDLDAFYVACERELNPALVNQPVAVSQYNPYGSLHETHSSEIHKRLIVQPLEEAVRVTSGTCATNDGDGGGGGDKNGSMIAVSYEARRKGVKRGDRGLDAIKKCPNLHIVQVPVKRGKADLTMYRDASHRVMETLISSLLSEITFTGSRSRNSGSSSTTASDDNDHEHIDQIGKHILTKMKRTDMKVEKASIDEIYIDLSIPVMKLTKMILCLQRSQQLKVQRQSNLDKSCCESFDDEQNNNYNEMIINQAIWKDVLYQGQEIGSTTIGGIEIMSHAARVASELSKNELSKGSQFQVMEDSLDNGSRNWWKRPLVQWTEVEIRLACGSALVARARYAAEKKFEIKQNNNTDKVQSIFTLSGGISSNKTLAKLASGLKKPNRQTMINPCDNGALATLFHPLKINRLRGLGGKFGESVMKTLHVSTVGDLAKVPLTRLKQEYPPSIDDGERPTADYLYNISNGICMEEVSERTMEKSISSGKTFRGALAINSTDKATIHKWISELVGGLLDRLNVEFDGNKRQPSLLVLSMKANDDYSHAISKSIRAPQSLSYEQYLATTMKLSQQFSKEGDRKIYGITVTASNFISVATGASSIAVAFQRSVQMSPQQSSSCSKLNRLSMKTTKVEKKNTILEHLKRNSEQTPVDKEITKRQRIETNQSKLADLKLNLDDDRKRTINDEATDSMSNIDKSILSQLPMSIQSEIRVASMSHIGRNSPMRFKKNDANKSSASSMKNWLTNLSQSHGKKDRLRTLPPKNHKNQLNNSLNHTSSSQDPDKSKSHHYSNESNIDMKTFAELPFHIQALVRKEMKGCMTSKFR